MKDLFLSPRFSHRHSFLFCIYDLTLPSFESPVFDWAAWNLMIFWHHGDCIASHASVHERRPISRRASQAHSTQAADYISRTRKRLRSLIAFVICKINSKPARNVINRLWINFESSLGGLRYQISGSPFRFAKHMLITFFTHHGASTVKKKRKKFHW